MRTLNSSTLGYLRKIIAVKSYRPPAVGVAVLKLMTRSAILVYKLYGEFHGEVIVAFCNQKTQEKIDK